MTSTGTAVLVAEVGPRDGLQNEATVLAPRQRIELVDRLARCGYPRVEVASFVSARRVPQMAEAEAVVQGVRRVPGVEFTALVLNTRGAERALATPLDRLNFALVATETFNRRNQGRSVRESVAEFEAVARLAAAEGLPCTATIGASFGCPVEGPVDPDGVVGLATELAAAGADEIELADTIGVAVPVQVVQLVQRVRAATGVRVGLHLHNTRNTGLANAFAALDAGVDLLDVSVGGSGGCPFAPKATGNVPSEDLLYLLHGSGIDTGIDIDGVVATARWLEVLLGHRLPGLVKEAGAHPLAAVIDSRSPVGDGAAGQPRAERR